MPPYDNLTEIARPLHVHGVSSDAEYAALQRSRMMQLQAARPSSRTVEPWDSTDVAPARITGGKWVVDCACGNAPSASPEWNVARCLECGAVFRNIEWPADALAIERVLLLRKSSTNRSWRSHESVEDLRRENLERGIRGH